MEVFADSHGRELEIRLRVRMAKRGLPGEVSVDFRPGQKFAQVISGVEAVEEGKTIVIIGGTDDTFDRDELPREAIRNFNLQVVRDVSVTNPVILVEIFRRFDDRRRRRVEEANLKIWRMNGMLYTLMRNYTDVLILNMSDKLSAESHYNERGLHLNDAGKDVLADAIVTAFEDLHLRIR